MYFLYSAIIGLFFFNQGTSAIKCFQCNSRIDPECATLKKNDTSSPFYKECVFGDVGVQYNPTSTVPLRNDTPMFCRKIYQKIHDRADMEITVRRCSWVKDTKKDCYFFDDVSHLETVCQCFEDGCNSADKNLISLTALTTSIFLTMIYYLC